MRFPYWGYSRLPFNRNDPELELPEIHSVRKRGAPSIEL